MGHLRSHSESHLKQRAAFTLIELLVCVAVIAILVAMLMPMLGQAKYRARLVVCTNAMRQAGLAALSYASSNDSWYPYRTAVIDKDWGVPSAAVMDGSKDDRALWREMSLDQIYCPFGDKVDLESTKPGIMGNIEFYFGMTFETSIGGIESGSNRMYRIGKNLKVFGKEFDILASDVEISKNRAPPYVMTGHPDRGTGIMQYGAWPITWTNSYYFAPTNWRGPIDMNFCREDGSVFRMNRVIYNDPRLSHVPYKWDNYNNGSLNTNWSLLPNIEQADSN